MRLSGKGVKSGGFSVFGFRRSLYNIYVFTMIVFSVVVGVVGTVRKPCANLADARFSVVGNFVVNAPSVFHEIIHERKRQRPLNEVGFPQFPRRGLSAILILHTGYSSSLFRNPDFHNNAAFQEFSFYPNW